MKHVSAWIGCALVFVGACSSETPTHDDAVKPTVDASTDATTKTPDDVIVDAGEPFVPVIEAAGSGGDGDTEKPAAPSVAGRGSAAGSGGAPTVMDAGVSDAGAAGSKAEAKAGAGGAAGHSGRGGAGGVGGAAGAAGRRAGAGTGGNWTEWLPWGDAGLPWSDGGIDGDWWNDLPFVPGGPTGPSTAGAGGATAGRGGAGGAGTSAAGAGGAAGAAGASATESASE